MKVNRVERRQHERGFVAVPALMLLMMLATLVGISSVYLSSSAPSFTYHADRTRAQALILAGVELASLELLTAPADKRQSNGSIRFRLDRASVGVDYSMEAARIDLNFAPREMIANLFEVLGAQTDEARSYADRVVGWRTAPKHQDFDSEAALYRRLGLSYGPKGGSFSSLDELWLVPGLPPALVTRALEFVTVYSGRREVDVFGAAPEVVAALPGIAAEQVAAFMSQRDTLVHTAAAVIGLIGTGDGTVAVYSGENVRLKCSIVFDSGFRTSADIIIQLQGGEEPYEVLSWSDPDERASSVDAE